MRGREPARLHGDDALLHVRREPEELARRAAGQGLLDGVRVLGDDALEERRELLQVLLERDPAERPGRALGERLVVHVARVLGREDAGDPILARLLHEDPESVAAGGLADRGQERSDLVDEEERLRLVARVLEHPADQGADELGEEVFLLLRRRERVEVDDRAARPREAFLVAAHEARVAPEERVYVERDAAVEELPRGADHGAADLLREVLEGLVRRDAREPGRELDGRGREERGDPLEASGVRAAREGVLEAEDDRGLGGLPGVLLHVEPEEVAHGARRQRQGLGAAVRVLGEALEREGREAQGDAGVAPRGPDHHLGAGEDLAGHVVSEASLARLGGVAGKGEAREVALGVHDDRGNAATEHLLDQYL